MSGIQRTWDILNYIGAVTTYADTAGTSVVNLVQRAFNGLGQRTQGWQAHGGTVNTSTTPSVRYAHALSGLLPAAPTL